MRRKICRQAEALLLVGVMLIGNTIYFPDRISAQENETESVQAESLQPAEEEKTEITETTESTENRTVAENTLLPTQEELESWEEDGTLEARIESIENIPWVEIHSYYLDGENMDAEYFVLKTDNNCYLYYEGEELLIRGIGNR